MSERSLLVKQLACIACEIEGINPEKQCGCTESHHLNLDGKAGQKRRGDAFQIPLGAWHHRGVRLPGWSIEQMTHKFGPSLVTDSRQFRFSYGTDDQLLALTNSKLERLVPATA